MAARTAPGLLGNPKQAVRVRRAPGAIQRRIPDSSHSAAVASTSPRSKTRCKSNCGEDSSTLPHTPVVDVETPRQIGCKRVRQERARPQGFNRPLFSFRNAVSGFARARCGMLVGMRCGMRDARTRVVSTSQRGCGICAMLPVCARRAPACVACAGAGSCARSRSVNPATPLRRSNGARRSRSVPPRHGRKRPDVSRKAVHCSNLRVH